jgi:hypothetical protein
MVIIVKNSGDHKDVSPPIVTYVTQITISLLPEESVLSCAAETGGLITTDLVKQSGKRIADHYVRVASMMELLAARGFTFRAGAKAVHCFSSAVEAGEAKRLLLDAGFKDREFQIVLEYTRGWGML